MAEKKAPDETTAAATPQTPPPPKMKKKEKIGDKKIVATRAARAGDQGYELSCVEGQVTVILEDGSEQVLKESQLLEPEKPAK